MKVQKFHTTSGFPSKNQLCLHACDIFIDSNSDIEAHVKKNCVKKFSCEESTTRTKVMMSCVDDEEAKLEMKLNSIPCYLCSFFIPCYKFNPQFC